MILQYRHYMTMTEKQVDAALKKRGMPDHLADDVRRILAEQKEALRAEKIRNTTHKKLWGELLSPLQREIKLVRAAQFYDSDDDGQRSDALATYETVLLQARMRIRNLSKKKTITPKNAALDWQIPNRGEHWSDWVPESDKVRVQALFDSVPYREKAKRKVPFQREILDAGRERRLSLQLSQETSRLEFFERQILMYKDRPDMADGLKKKITQLQYSIHKLTGQLQEIEDARRSKEQRYTQEQEANEDAQGSGDAAESIPTSGTTGQLGTGTGEGSGVHPCLEETNSDTGEHDSAST